MDILARFYTQETFSQLLVEHIDEQNPNTVLDLGVGNGSLIRAAYNKWGDAEFIAADIDRRSVIKINSELPFIKVYHANGLKMDVEKSIALGKSTIDIAVCNPPYLSVKDKKPFEQLLQEASLTECLRLNKITSDIVFLAQNLKLLRSRGQLGIILPDSVLTGKDFHLLRESILKHHKVRALIELPPGIFSKTEAKTHILLIEKESESSVKVPLLIAGTDGKCFDQIEVESNSLGERMDYSFHKYRLKPKSRHAKLGDFKVQLLRGNRGNNELRELRAHFIHSTSFKHGDLIDCKYHRSYKKYTMAEEGDIVIVRVGRGCVGKAALIGKGRLPISDCVYVIKADQHVVKGLWSFISSEEGREWVAAYSHGVCSKVLSRADILNLHIPL